MVQGLSRVDSAHVEVDRATAIAWAIHGADSKDVVLVAGKGHETYQEIQGVRHPFSDVRQLNEALQGRVVHESRAVPGGHA